MGQVVTFPVHCCFRAGCGPTAASFSNVPLAFVGLRADLKSKEEVMKRSISIGFVCLLSASAIAIHTLAQTITPGVNSLSAPRFGPGTANNGMLPNTNFAAPPLSPALNPQGNTPVLTPQDDVLTPPIQPPVPAPNFAPALQPPDLRPVLTPNSIRPAMSPQDIRPVLPPQSVRPALSPQGSAPAANPPINAPFPGPLPTNPPLGTSPGGMRR